MEQIYTALRKARKKRVGVYNVFILSLAFMAGICLMDMGDAGWLHFAIAMVSGAVICIITAAVFLSQKSLEKMLAGLLDGRGIGPAFRGTIDGELNKDSCFSFYHQSYRLSLYITDSWYILISTNASVIRRKEDIKEVSKFFHTNHRSDCLMLTFCDNTSFRCLCHTICNDVVAMTKDHIRGMSK